jgi:hypothetical protein
MGGGSGIGGGIRFMSLVMGYRGLLEELGITLYFLDAQRAPFSIFYLNQQRGLMAVHSSEK